MKIAFLTPEYPHASMGASGGIGTSINSLAKSIVCKGHSVRILVYGQKKDYLFWDEGVLVHQIKNVKIKGFSWYFTRKKIQNIIDDLTNKIEVNSNYKNKNIKIIELKEEINNLKDKLILVMPLLENPYISTNDKSKYNEKIQKGINFISNIFVDLLCFVRLELNSLSS